MRWLFERTIEIAAWTAMIAAWFSAVLAAWYFIDWIGTLRSEADPELLRQAGKSAAYFVGFAVGLGVLACIDRFIFDTDEHPPS